MSTDTTPIVTDVVIVGAGAAGIYAMHKLTGLGFDAIGFERGSGVGGTWYWNRYPGLYCDVESVDYSYSFSEEIQQEWVWERKFASQPEILKYLEWVADKLGVRDSFRFDTEVSSAVWSDERQRWRVTTDAGAVVDARYVIWATGPLSTPKIPQLEGADTFEGQVLVTAQWPHEQQDFTGKRVAVLGTGSSGIQVIPKVAEQAEHLFVLHRTPSYSLPAYNRTLDPDYVANLKASYREYRARARVTPMGCFADPTGKNAVDLTPEEREREYAARYDYGSTMKFGWTFDDLLIDPEANKTAADFLAGKIRERVDDPAIAEKLTPKGYPILTRRLCCDTDYYETFNRDNVTLVDLFEEQLVRLTPTGFETTKGEYEVDVFIYATGFDAFTGALTKIDIVGRDGVVLRDKWHHSPDTYVGLTVAGFPNMLTINGPLSPTLSNVILSIEQHVEWIADFLVALRDQGATGFEATAEAEADWAAQVAAIADATLFRFANSFYTGSNVAGKPHVVNVYLGGVDEYERIIREIAADGYRGIDIVKEGQQALVGGRS